MAETQDALPKHRPRVQLGLPWTHVQATPNPPTPDFWELSVTSLD